MPEASNRNWIGDQSSAAAMAILKDARDTGRPVILLAGAGISVDSGFPLSSELKEYLVHVREHVTQEGFFNVRQYIEEARWPSRHDLRLDLMLKLKELDLGLIMESAERRATQASLVSELRRHAPTMAASLEEIFALNEKDNLEPWKREALTRVYGDATSFGKVLGRRSPQNIAYRSLLFYLCDNNQATIDACFDHFMRDRIPTTTHQFIYFFTRVLRAPVIFTTNFDPLLEMAFASEGLTPRVYEVQGEGSIPSARLLLSQPLSIVKLHGGTHQMQTGFNLDDPLSPAALSSFRDLYNGLKDTAGQPPLTVVLGYSGSDRRVMDIVADQITAWRPLEESKVNSLQGVLKTTGRPNVLWVGRDPWEPDLLKSAVLTHPHMLQRDGSGSMSCSQFPAHLVRYRDGRLFLLESLQTLEGHFPIARSQYQAVNFVPQSVSGKNRDSTVAVMLKREKWRMALVHSGSCGGTSSTLVEVAHNLEGEGYRTIWLDLTEVVGVSALLDLISERITKLDSRLQPIRRPPLLRSLLSGLDGMAGTNFASSSERHEFHSSIQWLRLALRRGKYLLALDSLDEFPCHHPALEPLRPTTTPSELSPQDAQLELMCQLIAELASAPDLMGESRVAIALSMPEDSPPVFRKLVSQLRDELHHPMVKVEKIERTGEEKSDYIKNFVTLGTFESDEKPKPEVPDRPASSPPDELASVEQRLIWTVTILVACSARRIRSEVLLRRCVGEYLGRILPENLEKGLSECSWAELAGSPGAGEVSGRSKEEEPMIKLFRAGDEQNKGIARRLESLWQEPSSDHQHLNDKAKPTHDLAVLQGIHWLSGHDKTGAPSDTPRWKGAAERRWIYRTEGGYHWMHRDLRNGLYSALKKGENFAALAMAHHVIALFCYDELYERSRDPRAFMEYLFHRIAAIRLARAAAKADLAQAKTSNKAQELKASAEAKRLSALAWIKRLLIALHREKHALLNRVRLPGFIFQLMLLRDTLSACAMEEQAEESGQPAGDADEKTKPATLLRDLLQLLSDFFLASGHPHFALAESLLRLPLPQGVPLPKIVSPFDVDAVKRVRSFSQTFKRDYRSQNNANDWTREKIPDLTALRDIAYACHDPLLSERPFPSFVRSRELMERSQTSETDTPRQVPPDDWVKSMSKPDKKIADREARIGLSEHVYAMMAKLRQPPKGKGHSDHLKPWSEHDEVMDFFGGMVRKTLEFKILKDHPAAWIQSSQVYLFKNSPAQEKLAAFCHPPVVASPTKSKASGSLFEYELEGNKPLLRRSGRRQRHECYRLCLRARILGARHLNTAATVQVLSAEEKGFTINGVELEKEVARLLGRRPRPNAPDETWEKVCRNLADAESVLNRQGGPADRQAMAITRLISAELLLRRAEVLRWAHDQLEELRRHHRQKVLSEKRSSLPQPSSPLDDYRDARLVLRTSAADRLSSPEDPVDLDLAELKLACEKSLHEAQATISTVEQLMNEGRGENRWRFFYLLTRARADLLSAYIYRSGTLRASFNDLTKAARHLTGALSNCGIWTDRFDVLRWWWSTWEEVARLFHFSHEDVSDPAIIALAPAKQDECKAYIANMNARLGVSWRREGLANEADYNPRKPTNIENVPKPNKSRQLRKKGAGKRPKMTATGSSSASGNARGKNNQRSRSARAAKPRR